MEASDGPERQYTPHAFRANLFQPTSPPRVSTDPTSSSKKSHLPSLHHRHHRHHHYRNSSRHAKDAVQSAIQLHPPTSFGDLLKPASRSRGTSPPRSRRGSAAKGKRKDDASKGPPPKPVRPEDVAKEREKAQAQEEALRSSLQTLSEQSLKTSRQLDDTYYSILEKLSALRQTIGSLQDLSSLTKELQNTFQMDTRELTEEIQGQFEGFNNFETQEAQVNELEGRLKQGKENAEALTARLAAAKKRVEARAKLEAEWEARTNRRLQVLWGILGTIAGLMFVAVLLQQLKPAHAIPDSKFHLDFVSRDDLVNAPIPQATKDVITQSVATHANHRVALSSPNPTDLTEDSMLRIFDEL